MQKLDLSQGSFLCVDDELFSRTLVRQLLKDLGARDVESARDGADALKFMVESGQNIDCVIADFRMPRLNGLELLKAVRMGFKGIRKDIPFAMLTGNSDKDLVDGALSLRVNAFLVKPISKSVLADRLVRILPGHIIKTYAMPNPSASTGERVESSPQAINAEPSNAFRSAAQELPIGGVLARDVLVSGVVMLKSGHRLDEADIRRLQGFDDLKELIGPMSDIWLWHPEPALTA